MGLHRHGAPGGQDAVFSHISHRTHGLRSCKTRAQLAAHRERWRTAHARGGIRAPRSRHREHAAQGAACLSLELPNAFARNAQRGTDLGQRPAFVTQMSFLYDASLSAR